MLVDVLAGESPAGGDCPCDTVAISDGDEGDRVAESSEVNVPEGWAPVAWSGPSGGLANRRVVAKMSETGSPEIGSPPCTDGWGYSRVPSPFRLGEGQCRRRRVDRAQAAGGLSGVLEDDTSRKNDQRKHGTSRGSPSPKGTAKASPISRRAVKRRRACEWGGWGRLSVDGLGQNNPDRSEGPWGRAASAARMAVPNRAESLDSERATLPATDGTKDGSKPGDAVMRRHKGRPRLKASLGAVLGKTRRTES
jgi:hypothetical protein